MSLNYPSVGFSHVPAYEVSALPWVTGSLMTTGSVIQKLSFPKVTKYIKVRAVTTNLQIGFTENGLAGTNYFGVPTTEIVQFDVRVKEMFYKTAGPAGTADIFAGLTLIDSRNMSHLTSSTEFTGSVMGAGWQGVG